MRFKPRTDLERIVETINTNNFGRVGTSILYKHLKELDIGTVKRSSNKNEDLSNNNSLDQRRDRKKPNKKEGEGIHKGDNLSQTSLKENSFDQVNDIDKMKLKYFSKRKKVNSVAKKVMSDLHKKTHFKAASVFSVLGKSRNDIQIDRRLNNVSSTPNFFQNCDRKYNIDFNPLKCNEEVSEESKEKLRFLKTISSVPFLLLQKENEVENERHSNRNKSILFLNKSTSNFTIGHDSTNESYKKNLAQKEGKIIIDNQLYDKNDIHIVAKKVLTKCNYIPNIINKYTNKK